MLEDLRLAFRNIKKRPGWAAPAVVILALGLGTNAALFSVIQAIFLRPSPIVAPEELLVLWQQDLASDQSLIEVSYASFLDWREQSHALEDMAAFGSVNWSHVGELRFSARR